MRNIVTYEKFDYLDSAKKAEPDFIEEEKYDDRS